MMTPLMNENLILLLIVAVVVCFMLKNNKKREGFQLFEQRYDMRGFPVKVSDIRWKYIWPDSHFRINNSSGVMYESRWPPHKKEDKCNSTGCPHIFDRQDATCWNCRGGCSK